MTSLAPKSAVEAQTLQWDVTLPERKSQARSFGARPRATLLVTTPDHGEERIGIPVAVGRLLKAKHDADELHPQSRAELLYLVREQSARCASLRIEKLINQRDYSAQQISQKLADDGYAASVRESAVARAIDCGLVSDRRYAEAFVRTKVASGWGALRIERELKQRGIEPSSVSGWPDAFFDGESEDERAYQIACTRRVAQKNGYQKLVRFLCGRGFSMGCAIRVAQRVVDEARAAEDDLS